MKTKFLLFTLFFGLLLLCSACAPNESPEPLYTPETTDNTERTQVGNGEYEGVTYILYSDNTCAVYSIDATQISGRLISLPATYDSKPVTEIKPNAFEGLNVERVVLPETLTVIGERAFRRSAIQSIVMPDSVVAIGVEAFDNCTALESVTLSQSLTELPRGMFYHCVSLTEIAVPESVLIIGEECFADCKVLESVSLPSSLSAIGPYAFWQSGITAASFEIPSSVTAVGASAFKSTAWLKEETEEFVIVGDGVLIRYNGKSSSVNLPDSVRYISDAFRATAVTEINVPDSVIGIAENAFEETDIVSFRYRADNALLKALLG